MDFYPTTMKSPRYIIYLTDRENIEDLQLLVILCKDPNINDYGFMMSVPKIIRVKRLTKKIIKDLINKKNLLDPFHFLGITNIWDEITEETTTGDRKEIINRLEKTRLYHYLEL